MYDYFFQGWAGASCDIPCKPCSKNGLCNAQTGTCDCFEGWNGYRCLTPCEPCDHGTCQFDGTCLCDGVRRLTEGTYALRLTRDPFLLEKGEHTFEVQGLKRSRYVHPVYMNSYDVEAGVVYRGGVHSVQFAHLRVCSLDSTGRPFFFKLRCTGARVVHVVRHWW